MLPKKLPRSGDAVRRLSKATRKAPLRRAFRCAEEDSNLHPVIPDQALNLVTRVSYPSNASISSRSSSRVDDMDVTDDLDVATDVAAHTGPLGRSNVSDADRLAVCGSHLVAIFELADAAAHLHRSGGATMVSNARVQAIDRRMSRSADCSGGP
jgi:hypothetical protein